MSNIPSAENLAESVQPARVYPEISEERKLVLKQATAWVERCILESRLPYALTNWAQRNAEVQKFNQANMARPKPLPAKQASILTFSGDIKQGVNHKMFAFVCWDPKEQRGKWVNERPKEHPEDIWYFGINYLMLGGDARRIGNRAFSHPSINITPVIDRLRENEQIKEKGYLFSLSDRKDPKTGRVTKWFLKIHWQEDRDRVLQFRKERPTKGSKPKFSPKKPILGKPVGKVSTNVDTETPDDNETEN